MLFFRVFVEAEELIFYGFTELHNKSTAVGLQICFNLAQLIQAWSNGFVPFHLVFFLPSHLFISLLHSITCVPNRDAGMQITHQMQGLDGKPPSAFTFYFKCLTIHNFLLIFFYFSLVIVFPIILSQDTRLDFVLGAVWKTPPTYLFPGL